MVFLSQWKNGNFQKCPAMRITTAWPGIYARECILRMLILFLCVLHRSDINERQLSGPVFQAGHKSPRRIK